MTAILQIAHMHINRVKPGKVEGCGHFCLRIDALLPQNRHLGANAFGNKRCGNIFAHIKSRLNQQARRICPTQRLVFLLRTICIVSQAGDFITGARPKLVELRTRSANSNADFIPSIQLAHKGMRHARFV